MHFRKLSTLVATALLALAPNLFASLTVVLDANGYNTSQHGQPAGYRDLSSEGGEFTALVSGGDNYVASYASAATAIDTVSGQTGFETFCVEMNEEFVPGQTYDATISAIATPGGVNTSQGDPVSLGTAFLYSQFARGSLTGYQYSPGTAREQTADQLQDAIWYLEGELSSINPTNQFLLLAEKQFGDLAGAEADSNGADGVKVLNLTDAKGGYHQDQLIYAPVPEPATLYSGVVLLLVLAGSSWVRADRGKRLT